MAEPADRADGGGRLSHLDDAGRARMVDVSAKPATARTASARGLVVMQPETLALIAGRAAPKGDVLAAARLAGIMAAKRTSELIPLCHPLPLSAVEVELRCDDAHPAGAVVEITARCAVTAGTGVEMEALTAVSVAALTIYDMAKGVDRTMTITELRLLHKAGGRSGTFGTPP